MVLGCRTYLALKTTNYHTNESPLEGLLFCLDKSSSHLEEAFASLRVKLAIRVFHA